MKKILNVLSLFDGMSCGQLALNRIGVKYGTYYASEVDRYAIKVTQENYPNTKQLGSVCSVKAKDLPKIDLLIGGSPCQGFSRIGKNLGFSDERSQLFFEYVRLLKEIKPKYFLLENVIMKQVYIDVITKNLKVEPLRINSRLVSAQNRPRLYWTNIPQEKITQLEINPLDIFSGKGFPSSSTRDRFFTKKEIFNCLTAVYYKGIRGASRPAISTEEGFLDDNRSAHRMLTPEECEKLQTVSEGYTRFVSKTQRYKMLGNGWTIDVIAHIFKNLNTSSTRSGGNNNE